MRHCYKLLAAPPNTSLMIAIMQNQEAVFDTDGLCKALPPDAKKMAIGILQVINGVALTSIELRRIDHDHKFPIAPTTPDARFIALLSGQLMCLVGDECPALNIGEVWWIDPKVEALMVNKSGDDAILLGVTVRMD